MLRKKRKKKEGDEPEFLNHPESTGNIAADNEEDYEEVEDLDEEEERVLDKEEKEMDEGDDEEDDEDAIMLARDVEIMEEVMEEEIEKATKKEKPVRQILFKVSWSNSFLFFYRIFLSSFFHIFLSSFFFFMSSFFRSAAAFFFGFQCGLTVLIFFILKGCCRSNRLSFNLPLLFLFLCVGLRLLLGFNPTIIFFFLRFPLQSPFTTLSPRTHLYSIR